MAMVVLTHRHRLAVRIVTRHLTMMFVTRVPFGQMAVVMRHYFMQMCPAAVHVPAMVAVRVELPVTPAVGTGEPDVRAAVHVHHIPVGGRRDIHVVLRGRIRLAHHRLRHHDGRA